MTNPPFNRAPLNQGCYPAANAPPSEVHDPCTLLPKLRAAWLSLVSGNQSAQIRHGDMWQDFQRGDAKLLKQEIDRLTAICPQSQGGSGGRYATTMGGGGFNHPGY